MPEPIRILIADDHAVVRDGLAAMLEYEPDMTVAGHAKTGAEAVDQFRKLLPDVVLMDLAMPEVGGVEAIATIMAITQKTIHPTINLENPEPNLEFDIPTKAENFKINHAMSNSFGFGGHNASIIFSSFNK